MSTKQKSNVDSMNEDLKQWISEKDQKQLSKNIKKKLKNKKPKGMCSICGVKTAKTVCIKCGKSICNSCYFHIVGLCQKCLSKETAEKWKSSKPDWEKILGVDWLD